MSSSKIAISNSAILKVGGTRIASFDDDKAEAVIINEFYERSYTYLLATHYWGFAMKVITLAQLPTAPEYEYKYAYQLPDDYIRIQRTFPNSNYKIVGNELHSNESKVGLKYTKYVGEEDAPIFFEQAMMYYLAEQITIPITENQNKSNSNYAKYLDHLKKAKSLDAQQYPQDGFESFPLDDARFSGGIEGGGYR